MKQKPQTLKEILQVLQPWITAALSLGFKFLCSFNSVVDPDEISGVTEQCLFNFVCS